MSMEAINPDMGFNFSLDFGQNITDYFNTSNNYGVINDVSNIITTNNNNINNGRNSLNDINNNNNNFNGSSLMYLENDEYCLSHVGNFSYLNISCETILTYSIPLYGFLTPFFLLLITMTS